MQWKVGAVAVTIVIAAVAAAGRSWTATARATEDQPPNVTVCTLKVTGMTCGGCAAAVKSAAKKVDGVKDAKVSYEKGRAEIVYDRTKTTPEAIAKAITNTSGFKAEVQAPKNQ